MGNLFFYFVFLLKTGFSYNWGLNIIFSALHLGNWFHIHISFCGSSYYFSWISRLNNCLVTVDSSCLFIRIFTNCLYQFSYIEVIGLYKQSFFFVLLSIVKYPNLYANFSREYYTWQEAFSVILILTSLQFYDFCTFGFLYVWSFVENLHGNWWMIYLTIVPAISK